MSDRVLVSSPPARARWPVRALVRTARPRQWLKNLLVFAAPGAAGALDEADVFVPTVVALVAFCLASSGTYLVNDAADVEVDRRHPTKRFRPVAAEQVSVRMAATVGVVLMVAAVGVGFAVRWQLGLGVVTYLAVTLAYILYLKHEPVLDLFAVAVGFVLRAVAGGLATDIPPSRWFLIVVSAGSLFMVAGKRSAEQRALGPAAGTRQVLTRYSASYLAFVWGASAAAAGVAYCLWSFERAELATSAVPWFELSTLPFTLALFRYAYLVDGGEGGAPEDVVLGDRPLLVLAGLWVVVIALGIYG